MALARWQATIMDTAGNVLSAAEIMVRREAAGSPLATLFADRAGAVPIGNPFAAGPDGYAAFHAAGGAYRITASLGGVTREWRYVALGLAAESDGIGAGVGFVFDAGVADADPGAGAFRLDNVAPGSATQLYISNVNADGLDVAAWFPVWDDAGNPADRGVWVAQAVDGSATLIARVSGAVVDAAGYSKVPVTVIMAAGSFTAGMRFGVLFSSAGTHGTDGTNGVNPGLTFNFASATAMADPGAGVFRLNNAAPAGVTAIAVDDLSSLPGNPDVSAAVLAWDDSTQSANRGTLLIKRIAAPQNFALYRISGASTENAGWTQLAVTPIASAGAFANGDPCSIEFSAAADAAATATETVAGIAELATDAEIRAAAAGALMLTAADLETAAAPVTLTDAASIAVNWTGGINFTVTLAGNRTLANPTNGKPGQWRRVQITQDGTGSRTLGFGTQYHFPGNVEPVLSTAANAVDTLYIYCRTAAIFELHVGGLGWAT